MEMFPATANSPATELSAAITDIQTTITLLDASKLPDAPNIATIGVDESAETVRYEGKSGNELTGVTRGFSGTAAKAWGVGVGVARYFTAYDADALRENVADHSAELVSVSAQLADIALNIRSFGAALDGVTDDAPAIMAAHDALPAAGGAIIVPGVALIRSPLVFTKQTSLEGSGYATNAVNPSSYPSSSILKDGDFNAITLKANGSSIKKIGVVGLPGNGGDGICVEAARCCIDVSINSMGRDNLRIGGGIGVNANLWRVPNIITLDAGRYGMYVHSDDPMADTNAGILFSIDARGNQLGGLVLGNAYANTFLGVACQNNHGPGVHLLSGAVSNVFVAQYTEANIGGEFVMDAGSKQNLILGARGGVVNDGVVNNGTSNLTLGSTSALSELPYFFKDPFALSRTYRLNQSISGYWDEYVDGSDRSLNYKLMGTSASSSIKDSHNGAGIITREVMRLKINNGTAIAGHMRGLKTIDFPSIPAHSTAEQTITVMGAKLGDKVDASPIGKPEDGLIFGGAYVSDVDTVSIRIGNITAAAIDPASRVWQCVVTQHI
ncbi:hypothetical protein [Paenibacillus odorifer]|uniref:hypothetical protein n=2 Tax=Paenibacillus TaxID=44249 RepID=UPI00117C0DD0|nr:hypothetical protein [Paenibacillus odorifer]